MGLLQKDVAKTLNVTPSSIENWEKDKGYPKEMHFEKLRDFLGETFQPFEKEKILGRQIKEFRMKQNLSQKQLALKIGIAANTMIAIESQRKHILNSTYLKAVNYLAKNQN